MLGKTVGSHAEVLDQTFLDVWSHCFFNKHFFCILLIPTKFLPFSTDVFFVLPSIVHSFLWLFGLLALVSPKVIMTCLIKPCSFPTKSFSRKHLPDYDIVIALRVLKYLLLLLFTHFQQATGDYTLSFHVQLVSVLGITQPPLEASPHL